MICFEHGLWARHGVSQRSSKATAVQSVNLNGDATKHKLPGVWLKRAKQICVLESHIRGYVENCTTSINIF